MGASGGLVQRGYQEDGMYSAARRADAELAVRSSGTGRVPPGEITALRREE